MSTAANRNFATAQRERDRRIARGLEDPYDTTTQGGQAGWDAFFGALADKAQAANAAGMGFRANLGDIGRFDEPMSGGGRLTDTDRAGIAGNIALGQLTDANAARQLMMSRAADQRRSEIVQDFQRQQDENTVASAGVGLPNTAEGRAEFLNRLPMGSPQRAAYEKQFQAQDLAERAADLDERKQTEVERAAKAQEALQGGMVLSPEAIDENARLYLQTGTMPTLGMKDPGNRAKILNRAAELSSAGASGNVAANKADYKADTGSLVKLQQQRDAVGAFEDTALKNLDVFLDLAKKIPDTGSPALNKPLRTLTSAGLGDADLAAYNAARTTVIPEFAKILANPGLSGQLTDSARKEVEDIISGNATLAQTLAVAKTLKTDAANRRTSFDDQLKTIRERIQKGGAPPATAAPTAPAAPVNAKDPLGIR